MSERDLIPENDSQVERSSATTEGRTLDQATIAPQEMIETAGDITQAEAIEGSISELVEAIPITVPHPRPDQVSEGDAQVPGELVEAIPITVPIPKPDEQIGTMPIPIPDEANEAVFKVERPRVTIEATPIPLPGGAMEDPEAVISVLPIPIPGEAIEDPTAEVSATPITLPGQAREDDSILYAESPRKLDQVLPDQKVSAGQMQQDLQSDLIFDKPGMGGISGLPEQDDPLGGSIKTGGPGALDDFGKGPAEAIENIGSLKGLPGQDQNTPGHIGGGPGEVNPKYGHGQAGATKGDQEMSDLIKNMTKEEAAQFEKELQEFALNIAVDSGVITENPPQATDNEEPPKGSGAKMPRPDGEEGGRGPVTADDIKHEDLVVDPAMMQGGPQSSEVNTGKMGGVVSDPAEWQDPNKPESGVKYDLSQVSDPAGDEANKGKTETKG